MVCLVGSSMLFLCVFSIFGCVDSSMGCSIGLDLFLSGLIFWCVILVLFFVFVSLGVFFFGGVFSFFFVC